MTAYREVRRWVLDPEYAEWRDPNPDRAAVTALEHALQAATLAYHAEGDRLTDVVVATFLHDAARPISDVYHGEVMAEVLRGRIDEDLVMALRHHGAFQSDIVHGTRDAERWKHEPWYREAQRLAVWDAHAFSPGARTLDVEMLLDATEEVLSR